jgi:prepilin-type processing-associated H-X9-DG protein
MYAQDYDERLATSWSYAFPGDFSFYIQPYLKNLAILHCPSNPVSMATLGATCSANLTPGGIDNPTGEQVMWGYGFNTGCDWNNNTGATEMWSGTAFAEDPFVVTFQGKTFTVKLRGRPMIGKTLAAFAAPASCVLLGDTADTTVAGLGRGDLNLTISGSCDATRKQNWPRHTGGNNAAYVDGHAKYYRFNNTILPGGITNTYKTGTTIDTNQPAVLPDVCNYFSDYDGGNNPLNCKNGLQP